MFFFLKNLGLYHPYSRRGVHIRLAEFAERRGNVGPSVVTEEQARTAWRYSAFIAAGRRVTRIIDAVSVVARAARRRVAV